MTSSRRSAALDDELAEVRRAGQVLVVLATVALEF
jgi:hypothetical protein